MMPEERSEDVLALFELQETLPAESYIILDLYARSMVESYIILYLLRRKLFQYFCLLHYDIVFPCYFCYISILLSIASTKVIEAVFVFC